MPLLPVLSFLMVVPRSIESLMHKQAQKVEQEQAQLALASVFFLVACTIWERRFRRRRPKEASAPPAEPTEEYVERARACHYNTWSQLLGHIGFTRSTHGRRVLNRIPPPPPLDEGHQLLCDTVTRNGWLMHITAKEQALAIDVDAHTTMELVKGKYIAAATFSPVMGILPVYLLLIGSCSGSNSIADSSNMPLDGGKAVLDLNCKLNMAYSDVLEELGAVSHALCARILLRLLRLNDPRGADWFVNRPTQTRADRVRWLDPGATGLAQLRHFMEDGNLFQWNSPSLMYVVLTTLASDALSVRDKMCRILCAYSAGISAAARLQSEYPCDTRHLPLHSVLALAVAAKNLPDEAALAEAAPMSRDSFCEM